ncbi:hypothetical protein [Thalassotalea sp. ND16A]|uniref:hypothetical protein n=1 Tax=Thalassotalea sp. ND16A TaxID=1535422 RepID=UPI00051A7518|nr:hypothetical protein [Thalassotalea sp. ND16A]KGJ99591.1 hypothetical protein ND16A_3691 [Thalassotalea sp. ND16A]
MKYLFILFTLLSANAFAEETLSKSQVKSVEAMLIEAGSKMLYLTRDCDKPIDPSKFKELAKIKAFSEGYETIEGVSWKTIQRESHRQYGELKTEAPMGELCEQYKADIKGNYKFLKDIDEM